ncbi:ATPase [Clostridium sp.]|uniref:ATPase n=1 Tax=Clostridium sp. TaxID=1506 RepID=UPI003994004C
MVDEGMKSLELIDYLYDTVNGAPKMPMTGKIMLDRKEIIEILDEIKHLYPDDFKKAQWVVSKREEILSSANEHLSAAKSQTMELLEKQVQNHDIVQEARLVAEEIKSEAQSEARQVRIYAREYADQVLTELEKEIEASTANLLDHMKRDVEKFAEELTSHMSSTSSIIRENVKELRRPLNKN